MSQMLLGPNRVLRMILDRGKRLHLRFSRHAPWALLIHQRKMVRVSGSPFRGSKQSVCPIRATLWEALNPFLPSEWSAFAYSVIWRFTACLQRIPYQTASQRANSLLSRMPGNLRVTMRVGVWQGPVWHPVRIVLHLYGARISRFLIPFVNLHCAQCPKMRKHRWRGLRRLKFDQRQCLVNI